MSEAGPHVEGRRDGVDTGWTATAMAAGLLALIAVALFVQSMQPHIWTTWADRDMVRSMGPLSGLPASGAELNRGVGARIPGGGQYLMMRLLALGADTPVAIQRGLTALHLIGLLALGWAAWRVVGRWAAVVAIAVMVSAPMVAVNVHQIWNPAFVPPLAALSVAALVAAVWDGRGAAIVAWCVVCALGLQMHLSWIPWTVAGAVLLVAYGPPRTVRLLLLGALLASILYVPYLREELSNGMLNTRLLSVQPKSVALGGVDSWGWVPRTVLVRLAWLGGEDVAPTDVVAWSLRSVTLLGAAACLLLPLSGVDRAARPAAALGALAVLALASIVGDSSLLPNGRYFIVFTPAFALCVAVGFELLVRRITAKGQWTGRVVRLGLTAAMALAVWPPSSSWNLSVPDGLDTLSGDLDVIMDRTGWTLAETAGRVVAMQENPPSPPWKAFEGIDYLLRTRHVTFEGSPPPPCGVLFRGALREGSAEAVLRQALPLEPQARLIRVEPIRSFSNLLVYDGVSRCPTSLLDRYVESEEFADIRVREPKPSPPGRVERMDQGPVRRYYVNLNAPAVGLPDDRVHFFVDLTRTEAGVTATLRSPQLRGEGHLQGWYVSKLVRAPALQLEGADGSVTRVPFSEGFVGLRAAATPLSAVLPDVVAPARLTLTMHTIVASPESPWPPPDLVGKEVSVLLDGAWTP